MHGFPMFMSFSSLLTHPTDQRYDTQQWGGINMTHPSALNMTSARNQPFENQKFWENITASFSTINHAITFKVKSLNY